jgi:hypothetical protein
MGFPKEALRFLAPRIFLVTGLVYYKLNMNLLIELKDGSHVSLHIRW